MKNVKNMSNINDCACKYLHSINPLEPEFCFSLIFEILPKNGSYRLPTLRRDAHRKFFQ